MLIVYDMYFGFCFATLVSFVVILHREIIGRQGVNMSNVLAGEENYLDELIEICVKLDVDAALVRSICQVLRAL